MLKKYLNIILGVRPPLATKASPSAWRTAMHADTMAGRIERHFDEQHRKNIYTDQHTYWG